jgi:hypothetical protein
MDQPAATIIFSDHLAQFIRSKREAVGRRLFRDRSCKSCIHWRQDPGQANQGTCWRLPPTMVAMQGPVYDKDPNAPAQVPCPVCPGAEEIDCEVCGGTGTIQDPEPPRVVSMQTQIQRSSPPTTADESCGQWRRWRTLYPLLGEWW